MAPINNLRIFGTGKREGSLTLMNLPPSLTQPVYKPQFYVDEASLYSIAEDSREDRQSEINSKAGTESVSSSSPKKEPPLSRTSTNTTTTMGESIPILMDWGLDIDDGAWAFQDDGEERDSIVGARPARWEYPERLELDPQEVPTRSDGIFHSPKFASQLWSRRRLRNSILITVALIIIIAVTASVTAHRNNHPPESVNKISSNQQPPSAQPMYPSVIDTEQERVVYTALSSCPANNMTDVINSLTLSNQVFSELVAELTNDSSVSSEEIIERWSLMIFFFSTGGEFWKDGASWLVANKKVCEWGDGRIACDARVNGHPAITGLYLQNNNLKGRIPKELCCLSALRQLDLANNFLVGPMPACISRLGLTLLNVSGNSGLR